MSSSGSTSPTHKIMSSSGSTSPSPTKPLPYAAPRTSSAISPPNPQSVDDRIQLAGDATPSKEESKPKCFQDVGEIKTTVMAREETAEGSKGSKQKAVPAETNRILAKEFDRHVKKNQRLENIRISIFAALANDMIRDYILS